MIGMEFVEDSFDMGDVIEVVMFGVGVVGVGGREFVQVSVNIVDVDEGCSCQLWFNQCFRVYWLCIYVKVVFIIDEVFGYVFVLKYIFVQDRCGYSEGCDSERGVYDLLFVVLGKLGEDECFVE